MSKSLFFFERPASQRLKEGKEEKKTRVEEAREWTGQQVVKAFKQEFPVNKATWSVYRDSFYFKPDPKDKGYIKKALEAAAKAILRCDGILITAGAGMGVDSGLPDFRGSKSFWPALKIGYEEMSDANRFHSDPQLAWGLNFHQIVLYSKAVPHAGFKRLLDWVRKKSTGGPKTKSETKSKQAQEREEEEEEEGDEGNYFVWTSNVDAQFQKAGFHPRNVYECHGNLFNLQCLKKCQKDHTWELKQDDESLATYAYDPVSYKALDKAGQAGGGEGEGAEGGQVKSAGGMPSCPLCGALARPNLWFCTDHEYCPSKNNTHAQQRYFKWLAQFSVSKSQHQRGVRGKRLVILEFGAGKAIASVRGEGEDHLQAARLGSGFDSIASDVTLIRVNPRDGEIPCDASGESKHVSLPMGAAEATAKIAQLMKAMAKSST